MYTGLGSMIVKKLQGVGFNARQLGSGVLVSLNREITTMEVEDALDFKNVKFSYKKIAVNQVMIEELSKDEYRR